MIAWILTAIIALIIISLVVFFVRKDKKKQKLTPLASWALIFVLAGIIFSDNRIIGYCLMGIGIILAIIDIIKQKGGKNNNGKRKRV